MEMVRVHSKYYHGIWLEGLEKTCQNLWCLSRGLKWATSICTYRVLRNHQNTQCAFVWV